MFSWKCSFKCFLWFFKVRWVQKSQGVTFLVVPPKDGLAHWLHLLWFLLVWLHLNVKRKILYCLCVSGDELWNQNKLDQILIYNWHACYLKQIVPLKSMEAPIITSMRTQVNKCSYMLNQPQWTSIPSDEN
jgi:hypothetical protein